MNNSFQFPKRESGDNDPRTTINALEAGTTYTLGGSVARSLGQVTGWTAELHYPQDARCAHCGGQAVQQRLNKGDEWIELCDIPDCLIMEWRADEQRQEFS